MSLRIRNTEIMAGKDENALKKKNKAFRRKPRSQATRSAAICEHRSGGTADCYQRLLKAWVCNAQEAGSRACSSSPECFILKVSKHKLGRMFTVSTTSQPPGFDNK